MCTRSTIATSRLMQRAGKVTIRCGRCVNPRPRWAFAGAAVLAVAAVAQGQPIGTWYGTMSNYNGPRQARVAAGVLAITASVTQAEGPIAVWGDVRTMGIWTNTVGAQYNLAHAPLGPTYTHPGSLGFTWDGTTDGQWNYTVEANTGDVYRLDRNWQSPTYMFNVGVSSQGGITYDCATGTLWVANEGGCGGSGQCVITGAVTNYTMNGTPISSTVFGGSGLLNDLAIDVDGTFWAHATYAWGDELVHYGANGSGLGSYSINLGGDTIRSGEIATCPSPAGAALLAIGGLFGARRRR